MKKVLLVGLALAFGFTSMAQTSYQVKSDLPTQKVTSQERSIDPVAPSAPKIGDAKQASSSLKGTDIVTIISIGQSANMYGYGYAGGQKTLVWADNDLNAVMNLHRQLGAPPPNYSGNLCIDYSLDNGQTWTNDVQVYESNISGGQYNTDAARYPNGAIYNPMGNTDPANAYAFFAAPNLDGSNGGTWGGYSYGKASITNPEDTSKHLHPAPAGLFQYIPEAMTMTETGEAWVADPSLDWSSGSGEYAGEIILNHYTWNPDDMDFELEQSTMDAPMPATTYTYDEKIAFDPVTGMTGYISLLGNSDNIDFSTDAVYPDIYKTEDGGENWDYVSSIQLGGEDGLEEVVYNFLTDEQLTELFEPPIPEREEILYTTAFDHDIVVDACGNLHIGVIVGVTGADPYSIVSAADFFGAFHIYTSDGGETWHGNFLGSCQNFRGNYGDLTEDNRINISVSQDGFKVVVTWLDTRLEGVEDNNQPDVFARGYDINTNMLTSLNGEDAPHNVTEFSEGMWQAHMATASHYLLTLEDGSVAVPVIYEDCDPLDPGAQVQFKYIQDFTYTDADFTIESNNPHLPCYIGVEENEANLSFVNQNYPNPFGGTSTVEVKVQTGTTLSLEVFTLTGQKVFETSNGFVNAGTHQLTIDASNLTSGVYFYTVTAGGESMTKKMIVQ